VADREAAFTQLIEHPKFLGNQARGKTAPPMAWRSMTPSACIRLTVAMTSLMFMQKVYHAANISLNS